MALLNRVRRVLGRDLPMGRWHWAIAMAFLLPLCLGGMFLCADEQAWAGGEKQPLVFVSAAAPVAAEQPVIKDEAGEEGATPPEEARVETGPFRAVGSPFGDREPAEVEHAHPSHGDFSPFHDEPGAETISWHSESSEGKRLNRELKSLRTRNEQLIKAIQMLSRENQRLRGQDAPAAGSRGGDNWRQDHGQSAESEEPPESKTSSDESSSPKLHPELATILKELEAELMGEMENPAIEAELKRRLDQFRNSVAGSSAEDQAESDDIPKNVFFGKSDADRRPAASSSGKRDPRSANTATATLATEDMGNRLNVGEFIIEMESQGRKATVSFFDPRLELIIHIETPVDQLPELLKRLSKRNASGGNAPPNTSPPSGDGFQSLPDTNSFAPVPSSNRIGG